MKAVATSGLHRELVRLHLKGEDGYDEEQVQDDELDSTISSTISCGASGGANFCRVTVVYIVPLCIPTPCCACKVLHHTGPR